MKEGNGLYRAFVVRCWCDAAAGVEQALSSAPTAQDAAATHDWHFVVTEITHEQRPRAFPNLDTLIAYLQKMLTNDAP